MTLTAIFKSATTPLLDYALPPRCPACGLIVDMAGTICSPCWISIEFIGEQICSRCGVDLEAGAHGLECGACLADPPPYDRARAVMSYGPVARTIAHRLKYGRRLNFARVMASHMARLLHTESDTGQLPLLVPVPLHRWRIWGRGFNQSALIARHLAKQGRADLALDLVRRIKATPPLHGLRKSERARAVRGAFALAPKVKDQLRGRHAVVIDDIWTTGATATACADLLRQGGAAKVDVLCWARVNVTDY